MVVNHRKNDNKLNLAVPFVDAAGNVEGWFRFADEYLCPEVRYTSFPPTTSLRIGGRCLEIDRAVPLKIRLLEEHEDYHFWCSKKQHSQRINCGEYHKDFGEVEVGYSFSSPQTHIWFSGYAIHADCFENLFFSSRNATVRVTPEHVIAKELSSEELFGEKAAIEGHPHKVSLADLKPTRSLFEMVVEEGADFPIYTAAVPKRVETHKGYVTELVPTAEFVNDCERDIIRRDAWDVGAAVAQISDPVSFPPTVPPVRPFEHSALFWSFIFNKLRAQRLDRDDLEQAFKDIVLLNRYQQYEREDRRKDRKYQEALDRLAALFANPEAEHKATWPTTPARFEDCNCVVCRGDTGRSSVRKRGTHITSHRHTTPHQHTIPHHTPSTAATTGGKKPERRCKRHSHSKNNDHNEVQSPHRSRTSRSKSARFWDHAQVAAAANRLSDVCARPNDVADPAGTPDAESPPITGAPLYFYTGGVRSAPHDPTFKMMEYPVMSGYGY